MYYASGKPPVPVGVPVLKLLVPAVGVAAVVLFVAPPPAFRPAPDPAAAKAKDAADAARRAADAVAVRRFDDPAGFFSVEFPGRPQTSSIAPNGMFANLMAVAGYSYHVTLDGFRYEAKYERWEVVAKGAPAKLDRMTPKLLAGPGLPPPRVTRISAHDTIRGFEAAGVYEDRPRKALLMRRYVVPEQDGVDRYYTASVHGPADWVPSSAAARAFVDSFELTERALEFPLPGAPGAVLKK